MPKRSLYCTLRAASEYNNRKIRPPLHRVTAQLRYLSTARQDKLTKEQKVKESNLLPNLLNHHVSIDPVAFRELQLRLFSTNIREKPHWWEKMKVGNIRAHWTQELREQGVEEEFIVFFFKELERYREIENGIEEKFGFRINAHLDGIWRSNELVPEELKKELIEALQIIEDVPEDKKDWHPNSGKQVLDLIHPSLFPLIYNKTKSLETNLPIAPPDIIQTWIEEEEDRWIGFPGVNPNIWSTQFQWLPSDFHIYENGKTEIRSYINNLHPVTHAGMYSTLEKIFSRFVPMFNLVLDDLKRKSHEMRRVDIDLTQTPKKNAIHWPASGEVLDWDFGWDMGKLSGNMFSPPQFSANINGKTVKVTTKLANIHLTPESPEYSGGSWHVEGMNNERIVATGIYYYDCENVTDSVLNFRALLEGPNYWKQDSHCYRTVCGIDNDTDNPVVQRIGEILTTENRCIAFPNIYHHSVSPFGLIDPSLPGHRKILVFFLSEPNSEDVVSSSSIAPQQEHWLSEASPEELRKTGVFKDLSEEKFKRVIEHMKQPMTRLDAEAYRVELMNERSRFTSWSRLVQGMEYDFCEH